MKPSRSSDPCFSTKEDNVSSIACANEDPVRVLAITDAPRANSRAYLGSMRELFTVIRLVLTPPLFAVFTGISLPKATILLASGSDQLRDARVARPDKRQAHSGDSRGHVRDDLVAVQIRAVRSSRSQSARDATPGRFKYS